MDRERVANSPIFNIRQVVEDPHLKERGYFVEIDHPIIGRAKLSGFPFKLSKTPARLTEPPAGGGAQRTHPGEISGAYKRGR